jgi:hypothetical protein
MTVSVAALWGGHSFFCQIEIVAEKSLFEWLPHLRA